MPPVLAEGIKALLDMASLYRGSSSGRDGRTGKPASNASELMWLIGMGRRHRSHETHAAMERFDHTPRRRLEDARRFAGDRADSTDASATIPRSSPTHTRSAEMMWLRGWPLQKVLEEAAALQARLDLASTTKSIKSLYDLCLLCGGKNARIPCRKRSKPFWEDAADEETLDDQRLTSLAEYRWLGSYFPQQAVEKIGRFSRVNAASQHEMFDVLLTLERQRYREEGETLHVAREFVRRAGE